MHHHREPSTTEGPSTAESQELHGAQLIAKAQMHTPTTREVPI